MAILFQFGADVLFPMEGPLGGGAEGIAQPPRVAGTDCPVRKEDSPCPREAPQLGMCIMDEIKCKGGHRPQILLISEQV